VLSVGIYPIARRTYGSACGGNGGFAAVVDRISGISISNDYPSTDDPEYGFRIAAAIPAPSGAALLLVGMAFGAQRRRYRE